MCAGCVFVCAIDLQHVMNMSCTCTCTNVYHIRSIIVDCKMKMLTHFLN